MGLLPGPAGTARVAPLAALGLTAGLDVPWTDRARAARIEAMELVRVYETIDPVHGVLVRGLLEADGIEVLAKGEGSGPYRMGPVILFVPTDAADRATELIRASEEGALALRPEDGNDDVVRSSEDRVD